MLEFNVIAVDTASSARTGLLKTAHGDVRTPAFMPVGTVGSVKTLSPPELREAGVELVLGNTYHLLHLPGPDILEKFGGLARFIGWNGPTLTDSGGFQVFSLSATRRLSEDGVVFQSVYDGRTINLTPEEACRIQWYIGADIFYALDECPPYPATKEDVASAVSLTIRWAKRFLDKYQELVKTTGNTDRTPFLVVQGGIFSDLRSQCIEALAAFDPPGFAIGGVSVGEPQDEMLNVAEISCNALPSNKPRHLLGVGTPHDLLCAIEKGIDLFDCVLPTRNGRNGQAFTSQGIVNVRLARWREVERALDEHCNCPACSQYSIAYLHHLIATGEMLGMRLLSLHNISYYQALMSGARESIVAGRYGNWKREVENGWE